MSETARLEAFSDGAASLAVHAALAALYTLPERRHRP